MRTESRPRAPSAVSGGIATQGILRAVQRGCARPGVHWTGCKGVDRREFLEKTMDKWCECNSPQMPPMFEDPIHGGVLAGGDFCMDCGRPVKMDSTLNVRDKGVINTVAENETRLCKDCRWFHEPGPASPSNARVSCRAPKDEIDLVYGGPKRHGNTPWEMRNTEALCGRAGKLWEPRLPTPWQFYAFCFGAPALLLALLFFGIRAIT